MKNFPFLSIGVFAGIVSVFFPVEQYGDFLEEFLTSIGMVFVPICAVLFLEFLLGKGKRPKRFHVPNLSVAVVGMIGYWLLSQYEVWVPSLATIFGISVFYWLVSGRA
ncbi:hypothetical protein FACS1894187_23570 [Synergistales bacterium]|nr:hypothetical protein FACS1894187_23570 [Synergistales bacterium]